MSIIKLILGAVSVFSPVTSTGVILTVNDSRAIVSPAAPGLLAGAYSARQILSTDIFYMTIEAATPGGGSGQPILAIVNSTFFNNPTPPGFDTNGVGWESENGRVLYNSVVLATIFTATVGDRIGMRLAGGGVQFNKNGGSFSTTFAIPSGDLYAAVNLEGVGEQVICGWG